MNFEQLLHVLSDDELIAFGFLVPERPGDDAAFSFDDVPTIELDACMFFASA